MSLQDISYLELCRPFVQRSGTFRAILVKGIMRNNFVKLCSIWTSGSGGNVIKRHFFSRVLAAPLLGGAEPLRNFGRRNHEEQFCEIILNLDRWFRRRCILKIFLIWSSGT